MELYRRGQLCLVCNVKRVARGRGATGGGPPAVGGDLPTDRGINAQGKHVDSVRRGAIIRRCCGRQCRRRRARGARARACV